MLSMILAWFSVIFAVLSTAKYIVRKCGCKKLNRAFSHSHITIGTLLLVAGLLHGLFAGNAAWASLSDIMIAPVLFTWNWGTACIIAAALLAISYLFRKPLRKYWITAHRILTVLLMALIVIHVASVGIQLDDRVKTLLEPGNNAEDTVSDETGTSGNSVDSGSVSGTNSDESATNAQDDSEETETTQQDNMSKVIEETNELFSGAQLKDGSYEGSASGYNGNITVSVQVSGGQVTDITVLSESDTSQFFSRAKTVLNTIIEKQSLEVDAVSGATFSSAGLVNAVADALQDSVVSGTLEITQFDLSTSKGHSGK